MTPADDRLSGDEAIANAAKAVVRLRDRISKDGFTLPYRPAASLILTAQSLYRDMYRLKLSLKKLGAINDAASFVKVHRLLKRQTHFSFTGSPLSPIQGMGFD